MTDEVYEKAQLLADAIARSSELADLRDTERAMLADEESQLIISQFQDAQEQLSQKQAEGEEITEEDKKNVSTIEGKVENSPLISAYMSAQDRFTQMLDVVNALLANAIAGDTGSSCSTCGTDSCSGC